MRILQPGALALLASFSCACTQQAAGAPAPAANLLTGLTLSNTSQSEQAANFVTPMFGLPFAKGALPDGCSGAAPQFRTRDGAAIAFSESVLPACWSDGSLKWAAFMLLYPSSIAENDTATVDVTGGGTHPPVGSRSTADFTAGGLDLNEQVTGIDNLSGTWESDLAQGIAVRGADYKYMDGAAGAVWRVRAAFRQSGSDNGQLEGWWYVASLQNASGGPGGIRYLVGTTLPWYNVKNPAPNFRSFSAIGIHNGPNLVTDLWNKHAGPFDYTWSGSGAAFNADGICVLGSSFEWGWLIRLASTGTAPGGLSTRTSYFIACDPTQPGQFRIGTAAYNPFATAVTPTNAGTGTQTVTAYPYISQFGTLYSAQANGTWSFVRGAGSFTTDSTVRVVPSCIYLRSTHMIPPFACETYKVASNHPYSWFPMTAGPVSRSFDTTGDRPDLGPTTAWCARYLFTGAAVDEQVCRTIALVGAQLPIRFRDHATHAIPVVNDGAYTGMPAASPGFFWNGDCSVAGGFRAPSNGNVCLPGLGTGAFGTSHLADFTYIAYLLTGEPQYQDQIADFGDFALYSRYAGAGTAVVNGRVNTIGGERNYLINGVRYFGGLVGAQLRTDAWSIRDTGAAAWINFSENASYHRYFTEVLNKTWSAIDAYTALLPGFVTTNGLWNEGQDDMPNWELGYENAALGYTYARTENAGALRFMEYLLRWHHYIDMNFGTSFVGPYLMIVRQSPNNAMAAYVTGPAGIAMGPVNRISWDQSTQMFTLGSGPGGYTPANGDKWMFTEPAGQPIPNGFSWDTPYYAVNVSGPAFQLSATVGGAPIALTDTNRCSGSFMVSSGFLPPWSMGPIAGAGYVANINAGFAIALALGATASKTTQANLFNLISAQSSYVAQWEADPRFAWQTSY